MKRIIIKFISVSLIQFLFINLCLPEGICGEMQEKSMRLDPVSINMLSPRLSIQNDILFKTLGQQQSLLLPASPVIKKISQSWLQLKFPKLYNLFNNHPLMTVSMEGFHEKYSTQALNANSKGGLGAFFGDLIRGFKKIGVKAIAFQPDFSKRRRQTIRLKHDDVVNHVQSVLSDLNGRDFNEIAYSMVQLIVELSEKDTLSLKNFEQEVIKNDEFRRRLFVSLGKTKEIDPTGKENIAYVYTAVLSVLIDHATRGNKIDTAERTVRKIYRTMHANGLLSEKIIKHTIDQVRKLSIEKRMTIEHFRAELEADDFFAKFLDTGQVNIDVLYTMLVNYLARTAVNKEQFIVEESVSYDNEPGEYIKNQYKNEFVVTVRGLNVNNPDETTYYDVKFRKYMDGNIARIQIVCPELYGLLYKSDSYPQGKRQRFNEYMVTSWAMYAFLKHFPEYKPGIVHFNESPFILLGFLMQVDSELKTIPSLYTNHTVVQAGLPKYNENSTAPMHRMFEIMAGGYTIKNSNKTVDNPDDFSYSMSGDIGIKAVEKMKETFTHDGQVDLSMAAVSITDSTNAVSPEHAGVTKALFRTAKKIIGVLNGSSDFWKHEKLLNLEEQEGNENITKEELWEIRQDGKAQFIKEILKRTGVNLDMDKSIVSLIRRISNYKSQFPILKDIVRVICADRGTMVRTKWGDLPGLGKQVVVGGFAYSGSDEAQWIEAFLGWMNDPDLKGRFVFIPDSDVELLRLQAIGSDICINCPLPFEEACGTSDQRNALGGGLNVVIYDSGGGKEYLSQVNITMGTGNAWMVGIPNQAGNPAYENRWHFYDNAPKAIYDALSEAGEIFYNNPTLWKQLMLNAYHAAEKVSAEAMTQRYAQDTYEDAIIAAEIRNMKPIIKDSELESFINDKSAIEWAI